MLVVGGQEAVDAGSGEMRCVDGIVRVLNMSDGGWLESYDPLSEDEFRVPAPVVDKIGGGPRGGATATAPRGGWQTPALGEVFTQAYPTARIAKWYPYEGGGGGGPADPGDNRDVHRLQAWAPPVIGTLSALVLAVAAAVLVVCLSKRRRRLDQQKLREKSSQDGSGSGSGSTSPEQPPRLRILSWIMDRKGSLSGSTVRAPESVAKGPSPHYGDGDGDRDVERQEMDNTGISELMGEFEGEGRGGASAIKFRSAKTLTQNERAQTRRRRQSSRTRPSRPPRCSPSARKKAPQRESGPAAPVAL
jgi:hypothetical protein